MPKYDKCSDEVLVGFLNKGDEAAYAEIYKRYWAILYRHALRMVKDEETAEDVVQEIYLTLWDKARSQQFQSSLSGYLYTSVRNKILDFWSHEKVKAKYTVSLENFVDSTDGCTDYPVREKLLRKLIEQEVEALPESMRRIFELSRNSGLSYKEIADELNITEGTVRNQVSRALKILRERFGDIAILYLIFKL